MIQANELRIGNKILFIECDKEDSKLDERKEITVNISDFEFIRDNNSLFEGIPLTEEWIFKLGFINDRVLEFYRNDFTDSTIIIDYNFICLLGYSHVKLKYVHELQNLYFALTNEELTLKL